RVEVSRAWVRARVDLWYIEGGGSWGGHPESTSRRYTAFGPTAGCAGRPGHRPRSGVQDIPPLPMEPTALYFWIRPPPGGSAGPNGDPDPLPRCRRLLEPRPREALHPGGTPAPWLPSPLLRV